MAYYPPPGYGGYPPPMMPMGAPMGMGMPMGAPMGMGMPMGAPMPYGMPPGMVVPAGFYWSKKGRMKPLKPYKMHKNPYKMH